MKITELPATLRDIYSSDGFALFIESKLGNDLFINDPERAERIHNAAEHGCDGSTHAEHIEDWTEYAQELFDEAERATWEIEDDDEQENALTALEDWRERIMAEIQSCEQWHEKNGSLYSEVG